MVAKHLKFLCVGLGVLGIFEIGAAAGAGLAWLTINHPWFTVPLLVLAAVYVLGYVMYYALEFDW